MKVSRALLAGAVVSGAILAMGSTGRAGVVQVIPVVAAGMVPGTYNGGSIQWSNMQDMFDYQPVWDSAASQPTLRPWSGDDHRGDVSATSWSWIDFGPDYASVHISQTWIEGSDYTAGVAASPYQHLYWASDYSAFQVVGGSVVVPASAIEETSGLNFETLSTQDGGNGKYAWRLDTDLSGAPVTPQARYLVLQANATLTQQNNEYAFVGTIGATPEPASLGLIGLTGLALLRRRR